MDKLKISTRLSARNKKPRATKMSEAKLDALIEEAGSSSGVRGSYPD
jgi:hypothetical protein